jgi:hypothetical protein
MLLRASTNDVLLVGMVFVFEVVSLSMISLIVYRKLRGLQIQYPPGWRLRGVAEACFSRKTFALVFEPPLSDMLKEYTEALSAKRHFQARMALVRGYWAFWSAFIAQLPVSLLKVVYEIWKASMG